MILAPIVSSFYPFFYSYSIKLLIDAMNTTSQVTYSQLALPIGIFLMAQVMVDVFWRISNIAAWHSEPYVRRSILLNSYNYVQHHSYRFFQDNFTGAISSKLKGIMDGYDRFWAEMHHGLMTRVLKTIVGICALSFVNTTLGLFMMIWSVSYIVIMYRKSVLFNQISFTETEIRHGITGQIADKISNMTSIFSFSARKRELDALDKILVNEFIPKQIIVYKEHFKFQLVGGALYWALFGFLIFFMIHLRMTALISIGDFAFVFGISLVVAEDIWLATVSFKDFSRSMGDLSSALSILKTPQDNLDRIDAKPLVIMSPKIEFKNIGFGYGPNSTVFTHLNLDIRAGEKIGLVGHSGAGKSSLINLLLRYFEPHQGQIFVDSQDIAGVNQDSLREQIAVIPQDILLFHRTILENIRFGRPDATEKEVIEAGQKAHIHEFIQTLPEGYQSFVGERGIKLSGGQRQRISIARAILKDAPILILDEATSSLDSETEGLIQQSLNFLIEDKKKTVIAIAHRLSTLKHMDRIIVLDKGMIVEQGTHEQLSQNSSSLYKKLWDLQEI